MKLTASAVETPQVPSEQTDIVIDRTEETAEPAVTEGASESDDSAKENELPEWAKKELTRTRAEAASYRVQRNELQSRLEGAKTAEEFEAARTEFNTALAAKDRELVIEKFGLTELLAKRLTGNSYDELVADATELATLMPPAAPVPPNGRLQGGLDPNTLEEPILTPKELANQYKGPRF